MVTRLSERMQLVDWIKVGTYEMQLTALKVPRVNPEAISIFRTAPPGMNTEGVIVKVKDVGYC